MDEILLKYALQFGGFGILLIYLYLEGKRKDAKITQLEEAIVNRETAYNTRIDAYIEKSMHVLELLYSKKEAA